jgi:hypothetical protein
MADPIRRLIPPQFNGALLMLETDAYMPATAAEVAGNSTLILLLLAHLQQQGMIDPAVLHGMIEKAEGNARRDTPLLAGSAVVTHTLAWLQAHAA